MGKEGKYHLWIIMNIKGIFKTDYFMVKENKYLQMKILTLENFKTVVDTEKELLILLMEIFMKVNGKEIFRMAKDYSS